MIFTKIELDMDRIEETQRQLKRLKQAIADLEDNPAVEIDGKVSVKPADSSAQNALQEGEAKKTSDSGKDQD